MTAKMRLWPKAPGACEKQLSIHVMSSLKKSAEELVLEPAVDGHDILGIHALTLGANYDLLELQKTRLAAGAQWSFYGAPESLNTFYGKNPIAFQVYLRIYPALMKMNK